MTVKLARLESVPEIDEAAAAAAAANRRREPRFTTWFDAVLENTRGNSAKVLLAEVSLHGCRIRVDEPWARVGGFVTIRIDEGTRLQAIVRWVRDGSAGMEFLRAIPAECTEWHDLMDAPF